MNLSVGIVGLPNVGKSTLFNALLKKQTAFVANYPFATIEPNIGVVPVPDLRLSKLSEIEKEENKMEDFPPIVPAVVKFVDIAGLVKGASVGAGLGNKFLSYIREASVIAHVVRAFEDENIVREGSIDIKSDYETIRTELALSDLQQIQNLKLKTQKSKVQLKTQNLLNEIEIEKSLNKGEPFDVANLTKEEEEFAKNLNLLSLKPEIIVLNVAEEDYSNKKNAEITEKYSSELGLESQKIAVICAKIEAELAALAQDEQEQYLKDLGIEESGLSRLIKLAYEELGLISFLTAGEKEVRAWTIKNGTNAQNAAGEIHTDFIKNFIKAEVVPFEDFMECRGWKSAREKGKARLEGKDYIVQDGDVVEFKIGR